MKPCMNRRAVGIKQVVEHCLANLRPWVELLIMPKKSEEMEQSMVLYPDVLAFSSDALFVWNIHPPSFLSLFFIF
jgi:hypothetical protein